MSSSILPNSGFGLGASRQLKRFSESPLFMKIKNFRGKKNLKGDEGGSDFSPPFKICSLVER
jgi:hypothetical protein